MDHCTIEKLLIVMHGSASSVTVSFCWDVSEQAFFLNTIYCYTFRQAQDDNKLKYFCHTEFIEV